MTKPFIVKNLILSLILTISLQISYAQFNMKGMGNQMMNAGHFYGKIIDSMTKKPVEYASVSIWGNKWDTATRSMQHGLLGGMITPSNGNFSIDGLPVMGEFTLKISFIGYADIEKKVKFDFDMSKLSKQAAKQDYSSMMNAVDKDLGNIILSPSASTLKQVVVDGTAPALELKLDKKVFNVDKSLTSTGGTAQELMRAVPTVNVDIDGNVTLRNATPQIFVDGKPTTLTLDQIPADAIESIEIITNPSAKYDASGGQGGILNIVLKKSRTMGYNGNIRSSVDERGKYTLGGNINTREGKFNLFLMANFSQRKSIINGVTSRDDFSNIPTDNIYQTDLNTSNGYFIFGRLGMDYFIDNRNTITLSAMIPHGHFAPTDAIANNTQYVYPPDSAVNLLYNRNSTTERNFSNYGGSFQYKHIFPQPGRELTGDLNYNTAVFNSAGNFTTQYYDANNNPIGIPIYQQLNGSGNNKFIIGQIDYVNPIGDKMKFETGVRTTIREFQSINNNYIDSTGNDVYVPVLNQINDYNYTDEVYAGYVTFSQQLKKFSYQVGLRAESSRYVGTLTQTGQQFENLYPISLFPSGSMTYNLTDKDDIQFSYSRRINRPGFRQIIPYIDYSDSLNLSQGNPALKPEFTNSVELSYLKNFNRNNNILITAWYKQTEDLITRYQVEEYDTVLQRVAVINTYENANSANAYGLEITTKNAITKWFDITFNVNVYKSSINGTNLDSNLINNLTSYYGKMTWTIRLPKDFTLQLFGDYQSKTSLPYSSGNSGGYGGMGGGGGNMFGGSSNSTLQGYIEPTYGLDIALKYEFMKNKAASLTLNGSDILKTRKNEVYSSTAYYTQTVTRTRDPQFFRINFAYRFGKMDVSLFKRKNMKVNTEGMDMGM